MQGSSQHKKETMTKGVRVVYFVIAMAMAGAFFLPWATLDGVNEPYSGAELAATALSPAREYFFAVSPIQAVMLIACPVVAVLFSIRIAAKQVVSETAPVATILVLAAPIVFVYGVTDLVSNGSPMFHFGLLLTIVLSAVLLMQYLLFRIQQILLAKRKLPSVYRILSLVTGKSQYR